MDNSLSDWIERLNPKALPAMAPTRQRVLQLLDSPNTTNTDLQRIISRDPGFTLAIFRLFNQLPQPPKEPVTNLAHAIALLGIEPTTQADQTLPDIHKQLTERARQALYDCYSRAAHAGWYAYNWGHDLRLANPEEMAIAALLHELGEMLLWTHADRRMERVTLLVRGGCDRATAEVQIFGFTLQQLSRHLAERWNLPPLTARAQQPIGAFETRSLAVMLASALARETTAHWHSKPGEELIELTALFNRLSPDQGRAYIHSLAAGAARNLSGLPLTLSAYALLSPPAESSKNQQQQPEILTDTTLSTHTRSVDADTVPIQKTAPALSPTRASARRPAAPGTSPLQASLSRIFRDLRQSAGTGRAMFAILTPDRKTLKVKYISGAESGSPLRQFQHPVGERHLLTLLLKKHQSIWLHDSNREKLLPLMDKALRTTLDTRGFFLSSLYVKNHPVGILYADRTDNIPLDNQGFTQFKSLTQRLCNELSGKT